MSLFDVIKYPISDLPTEEEISALPDDVINELYKRISHGLYNGYVDTYFKVYAIHYYLAARSKSNPKLLTVEDIKEILRDYNEPI